MKIKLFILALNCIFLTGCGYQFGEGEGLLSKYQTISVPYVEGDYDGSLTAAVIHEIIQYGSFEYRTYNGALTLSIVEISLDDDNIGFNYERKKRGELTRDIVPVESRLIEVVEVTVKDTVSGCALLGPVRISACVDYDHDYYSSRNGINTFSLGQLSDLDQAYDSAQKPLNQILAKKIVSYISQSW